MAGNPRLLLAVDLYPDEGGIAAIVENCVAALEPTYEVHLAIVDEREGRRARLSLRDDRVHALTSRHVLKPYLAPTSVLYPIRVGAFLRSLVRRLAPKALLVQDGLFLPLPGWLATRRTATRLAVMDHGTVTNSLNPRWVGMLTRQQGFPKNIVYRVGFALDRPWRELRWRLGFRAADAVWYVGEELKPWIERAGAKSSRYAQVVPLDFAPPFSDDRGHARALFGISASAPVVNMVTRLSGEKGFPLVLDAVTALRPRFPDLIVLVVGDGALKRWIRNELATRDLLGTIRLLGRLDRPEIQRVHHASDFHLYAGTIGCGMSIALLEAMSAGVIPIVSNVPGEQRDLVADAGWVFPANDLGALERSLAEALETSEPDRTRLRNAVAERIAAYSMPSLVSLVDEFVNAHD